MAGERNDSDELTAAASRSIHFIEKDSDEHIAIIFGSAWPSPTASFSSSSNMWTMSSVQAPAVTFRIVNLLPEDNVFGCAHAYLGSYSN